MYKYIYNYICCIRYKEKQNFTTLHKIWNKNKKDYANIYLLN